MSRKIYLQVTLFFLCAGLSVIGISASAADGADIFTDIKACVVLPSGYNGGGSLNTNLPPCAWDEGKSFNGGNPSIHLRASDPYVMPAGQKVLDYLAGLSFSNAPHGIISGQWTSNPGSWSNAYELFVQGLYKATGKYPGLYGSAYGTTPAQYVPEANWEKEVAANQALSTELINYWNAGGLVSVTWFPGNPWYPGSPSLSGAGMYSASVVAPQKGAQIYGGGSSPPPTSIPKNASLLDLLDPSNPAGAYFQANMDVLAANLQTLQDAGVIVLFRPLAEMNGNWFWWGVQSATSPTPHEFRALWHYVHHYLITVKGLHNLLWVFAPNNSQTQLTFYPQWKPLAGIVQPAPYYYPGDWYTDIVGVDYYSDKVDFTTIPTYQDMLAFEKPFALVELGAGRNAGEKEFNFDTIIHDVAANYPAVSFFQAWQDNSNPIQYLTIISNPGATAFMNDPINITRDKIDYQAQPRVPW